MSFLNAVKLTFVKDIEETIKKHRDIPLGQFSSDIEVTKTQGMIVAWERAIQHFKMICESVEGTTPPEVSVTHVEENPNITDAEVVVE